MHPWSLTNPRLRLLLRLPLALAMISSGIFRAIPVQMPPLQGFDFLRLLGDHTQGELLWTFVGASPVFQSFTGLAALIGGVLLLFPRTALAGALISAANLAMAITLSVTYDLPFKLYLSCLLVLALLLIAPDLRRLFDLLLLGRTVEPVPEPPAGRPERIVLLVGLLAIAVSTAVAAARYRQLHPPEPPLYGVWTVEELTIDGEKSTDPRRWRWTVFQDPGALDVELWIGARKRYPLALDMERKTMRLGRQGELSFAEPEPYALVLDGRLDGRRVHAKLRRIGLQTPWFHWIVEPEWTFYD